MTSYSKIYLSKIKHRGAIRISIRFEKNSDYIQKIKTITGRRWSQTLGCWHLPYEKNSFDELEKIFGKDNLVFPEIQKPPVNQQSLPTPLKPKSSISFRKLYFQNEIRKVVIGDQIIIQQENSAWLNAYVPGDKKGWVEVLKNINGRKWNVEKICWEIPNVKQSYRQLKMYIGLEHIQFDFKIQKDILEAYPIIAKKKKYAKPNLDSLFNEMQKRAITALEEKLILEGKRQKTIKSYLNQLKIFLRFYKNKKPSTISFKEITAYIIIRKKHDNISDKF